MADIFTKFKRSQIMASVTAEDTKPEVLVRSFLFRQGFRFRKNVKTLPGKPDIVLHKYKSIVFIHGCFWHGHRNCKKSIRPTTNVIFWNTKIDNNMARDKKVLKELKRLGWRVFVIWECDLRSNQLFEKELQKLVENLKANHKG